MMKKYILLFSLSALLAGCQMTGDNGNDGTTEQPEVAAHPETPAEPENAEPELVPTDVDSHPSLKGYLQSTEEQMKDVPKTFVATFMGEEMGDYFHISFQDEKGNYFDFGDARNDFGEYGEGSHSIKSEYEGKKFKLTWDWKLSSFACCDGAMEPVVAKIPSVTALELVE